MAELVDALASGASVPRDVEVQVLSSVPTKNETKRSHFSLVEFYNEARTYFEENC